MSCLYILESNHLCVVTLAYIFPHSFVSFQLEYSCFTELLVSAVQRCQPVKVHVSPLSGACLSPSASTILVITEQEAELSVIPGSLLVALFYT